MGRAPLNLALRFLLEIAGLVAMGYWGWAQGGGVLRYVLALGVPLVAAFCWGAFRVPGEAPASGGAPVAVPGPVRLLLELAVFGFATWGLADAGAPRAALVFGGAALLHYVLSYDRIAWLLRQ